MVKEDSEKRGKSHSPLQFGPPLSLREGEWAYTTHWVNNSRSTLEEQYARAGQQLMPTQQQLAIFLNNLEEYTIYNPQTPTFWMRHHDDRLL